MNNPNNNKHPIVLLHGVGLNSKAWDTSYLTAFNRAIAPNMPGHGDAPPISINEPSIEDYSDWLISFIKKKDIRSFHLVGHSMGALIAISTAIKTRHSQLNCLSLSAISAVYKRDKEAQLAIQKRLSQLQQNPQSQLDAPLNRWFGDPTPAKYQKYRTLCQQWLNEVDVKGYQQAYGAFALASPYSQEELSKVLVPSLFITGELDTNSTPDMSILLAKSVIDGTPIVIKEAAHMLTMTHSDKIIELITEHIIRAEHE